jgi:hypothetical protein
MSAGHYIVVGLFGLVVVALMAALVWVLDHEAKDHSKDMARRQAALVARWKRADERRRKLGLDRII